MKKFISILTVAGVLFSALSCEQKETTVPIPIGIQLQFDGEPFDVEGIAIVLSDATGIVDYTATTNASGYAKFQVPAGAYSATSVYKITEDGERIAFNGTNANIAVSDDTEAPFVINLLKVVSQQVIIKELYVSGCLSKDGLGAYQSDQFFLNSRTDVSLCFV